VIEGAILLIGIVVVVVLQLFLVQQNIRLRGEADLLRTRLRLLGEGR